MPVVRQRPGTSGRPAEPATGPFVPGAVACGQAERIAAAQSAHPRCRSPYEPTRVRGRVERAPDDQPGVVDVRREALVAAERAEILHPHALAPEESVRAAAVRDLREADDPAGVVDRGGVARLPAERSQVGHHAAVPDEGVQEPVTGHREPDDLAHRVHVGGRRDRPSQRPEVSHRVLRLTLGRGRRRRQQHDSESEGGCQPRFHPSRL